MNATKEYPTIYGSKWLPVVLYGFASLVDWQLTQLALATGGAHEANPILAAFGPLGMLGWKAFGMLFIVGAVWLMGKVNFPKQAVYATLWLNAVAMVGVCLWNGWLLVYVL